MNKRSHVFHSFLFIEKSKREREMEIKEILWVDGTQTGKDLVSRQCFEASKGRDSLCQTHVA